MIHSTRGGAHIVLLTCLALAFAGFPSYAQNVVTFADETGRFVWEEHPTLRLGKTTRIAARAAVQADTTGTDVRVESVTSGGMDLARRRLGVEGVLFGLVEFQVERELRHVAPWRDVYANYRQFSAAQIQGGHFKLPFSLDANTGATNLNFVYRSLAASQLAPGRDQGLMLHGRLLKRTIRYEIGLFDQDGRNARTSNVERVSGGRTGAFRIRVAPFVGSRSALDDLQAGMAITGSKVPEGYPGLHGSTVLGASFFPSRYWVNGTRRRVGVEFRWRPGPFSVESEYMRVTTERRGESVEDTDLSPLVATGWYVSGTWAATGERKADGLNRPRRTLFQGGFGAVEFAVRLEALAFRSNATGEAPSSSPRAEVVLGNRIRVDSFGVNWYVNRWIKVQGNLIHQRLDDPALGPRPSQRAFWSEVLRLQLTL
jgi:phosphate-selective porin